MTDKQREQNLELCCPTCGMANCLHLSAALRSEREQGLAERAERAKAAAETGGAMLSVLAYGKVLGFLELWESEELKRLVKAAKSILKRHKSQAEADGGIGCACADCRDLEAVAPFKLLDNDEKKGGK